MREVTRNEIVRLHYSGASHRTWSFYIFSSGSSVDQGLRGDLEPEGSE